MDNQQINKLVAEKIMGWETRKRYEINKQIHEYAFQNINHPDRIIWLELPKFSTNINDAWLIIKALEEKMFFAELIVWADQNECTFEELDNSSKFWAEAKTIEMAICLAALKSVGVEVPV